MLENTLPTFKLEIRSSSSLISRCELFILIVKEIANKLHINVCISCEVDYSQDDPYFWQGPVGAYLHTSDISFYLVLETCMDYVPEWIEKMYDTFSEMVGIAAQCVNIRGFSTLLHKRSYESFDKYYKGYERGGIGHAY